MNDLAKAKTETRAWFESLRDRICAAFEGLEDGLAGTHRELPAGRFELDCALHHLHDLEGLDQTHAPGAGGTGRDGMR